MTRAARFVTPALALTGAALALRALVLALQNRVPLAFVLGLGLPVSIALLFAAVAATGYAAWNECRDPRADRALAALRRAFVVAVLGWLALLAFVQPFQRIWFDLALGASAGAWAAWQVAQRRATPRLVRALGLALFALCAAALGLELGLRAYAALSPAPLLASVGAGPRETIRRFRLEPGQVHNGFPCNARGFFDGEFGRKAEGDERPLVVAIGDSFNVGAVPHAWHYTTLCEELSGARIHNVGVPGVGPPEYVSLLVEEALPLAPDLILVSVFVGNDLDVLDVGAELPDPFLRSWLQRERVLLFVLPGRVRRLAAERRRAGSTEPSRAAVAMDRDQALRAFPWLEDPALEESTLAPETFLRLETARALAVCGNEPPSLALFQESMLAMQAAAGDIPLRVLLVPDEFQVEDELWEELQRRAGRELDRDLPTRLLTAWLAERQIPCLDLLPFLRAIPVGPDGRRHLYHKDDTHWNARGNRVAAEALARFLRNPE